MKVSFIENTTRISSDRDDFGISGGGAAGGIHSFAGQGSGAYVPPGSSPSSQAGSFSHPPQSPLCFSPSSSSSSSSHFRSGNRTLSILLMLSDSSVKILFLI